MEFLAFLLKVRKQFPALFISTPLKKFVNSLHSDRVSFQFSVVHGAPGTSVQFISYFEVSRLVWEGERSGRLSHVFVLVSRTSRGMELLRKVCGQVRVSPQCRGVCYICVYN